MDIVWRPGPPLYRGSYWIVLLTSGSRSVFPVDIGPALVDWNKPDAPLLLKMLGGGAHSYSAALQARITHHAYLTPPEAP